VQRVLPLGLEIGRLHQLRSVFGAQPAVLREVDAALCGDPSPRASVVRLQGAWLLGEYERGEAMLEPVLAAVRGAGDEVGLINALSWAAIFGERREGASPEVVRLLREALELCRRRGHRRGEVVARARLGWMALGRGDRDEALVEARAAVAMALGPQAAWTRYVALNHLAEVLWQRGDGHTLEVLDEALALANRMASPGARTAPIFNKGLFHAHFVSTEAARPWYREALELERDRGSQNEGIILGNLGVLELAEGDPAAAMARLTEALSSQAMSGPTRAWYHAQRARTRREQGDLRGALADLDDALALGAGRNPRVEGVALLERAVAQASLGDRTGAASDLELGASALRTITGPGTEAFEIALARAEVALALGEPAEALAALELAQDELDALGIGPRTVCGRLCARVRARLG
jgi:tetratricopeptide (TPR) repeat protein